MNYELQIMNGVYKLASFWVKFLDSMNLPFLLLKDFFLALTALLDRFLKYPYLLNKASNGFVIDHQGFIKITKRLVVTYLIGFMVFSGTGLFFLFNPFGTKSADAAWFNDNWAYRKAVTVTVATNTSDRTNADLYLTIDTTGITTKLQSACQDLRFTDTNGNIFPYYIQSCNNNSATNKIWVRTNLIPKNTTTYTMYMYYGNPSASAGSNAQVFNLYSDVAAYWSYEESSAWNTNCNNGTKSILDSSGNASNMQPCPAGAGAATQTTSGKFGSALALNGTTQYADTGADIDQLDLGATDDITISAWVYFNSTASDDGIINKKGGSNSAVNQGWTLYHFSTGNGGNFCLYVSDGTTQEETCTASYTTLSTWVHVVAVFNRNSGTGSGIWLNGVRDISGSFTITTPSVVGSGANTHFTNTGSSSSNFLDGRLDDVRVYKRALSIPEIGQLYSTTGNIAVTNSFASEEKGPAPTLYWEFDQGQGTTAEDATSNTLDGTLNNTPTWQTENFCISSQCLYFGATNQNVSIADNDKLDFAAADNFTVGAWVKRNGAASANTVILQKTGANIGSTYTGYKLYMDASGDFCFDVQDGTNAVDSACTTAVDFDDDSWHFVQGVKAATTSVTLYVDGKQRAQDASIASSGTLANASTFRVGIDSDGTSNDWLGFIDEVKVTRDQTARTAAQVQADYNTRGDREGTSQQQGNNNQNMPAVLSNGLVGYWKMDETAWTNDCSTATVTDSSGNANSGISCPNTTGPTGAAAGKFGFAGSFDGSNDYLSVANASSLNPTGSWTVSTWFTNADSSMGASEMYLLSKGNWNSDADSPYRLGLNFGTLTLQYRVGFTAYTVTYDLSGAGYTINQWIHATGTYDASTRTLSLYVNGKLVAGPTTQAATYANNTSVLYLGAHSSGQNFWKGKMDETRIYNRALSAADAAQLANWGPGPNAYWKLDEGSGATAYDSSGNGNNSTSISGSPSWTSGKYGKTINFDGVNDAVTINESTTTDFGKAGQSYTVMAWVKNNTSSTVTQPFLTKNSSSDAPGAFQLRNDWNTNKPQFYITNSNWSLDSNVSGTTTIRDGNWHHVAGIRNEDTNQIYIYVDGKLEGTATDNLADTDISSDKPVIIAGESNGGTYWPGPIDDVKLYNYARSASQIVEDMNAGHPAPGSPVGSPLGYWKFNEGADDMCSGGSNDACNSGSGGSTYDGANTSSTWTQSGKFGRAYSFNGSSSRVDFGDMTALETAAQASWSFWVRPTTLATSQALFVKANNAATQQSWAIMTDASTSTAMRIRIPTGTTDVSTYGVTPSGVLANSTWAHVLVSFDGTGAANTDRLKVYVNGKPQTMSFTGTIPASLLATTSNVRAGAWSDAGGTFFNGTLDEMKVFLSPLTASQAVLDMNQAQAQVLGAISDSSTAGNDNASTRTAQSGASEYCIPGDSTTCTEPVGRWDFESQSSNNQTHYDTSGNANNCTDFNGKALAIGKVGKATDVVSGVGGGMGCGSGSTLDNLPASGMTIEGWIYPDSTGLFGQGLIARKNGYYVNGWWLNFNSSGTNSLGFNSDHATTDLARTTANNTVTLNAWNHVAVTWTGSTTATTVKIYINGRETTYSTTTDGVGARASDAAEDWNFGDDGGGTATFDGKIDQFRAFNYVRTPAQIAYDMNRGAPIAYWKMDECQGTTINDSAGNSLSGTWSGSGGTYTSPGTCSVSSASSAWYNGAAGKRNYSLAFDGSDDIVDFGTPTKLNLADSITMSVWVKPDSTALGANYHAMIGNYDGGGTTAQYEFAFKDGNLNYNYGASSSYVEYTPTTSISFTAGNWYHIIFTHSGSNSTGYFYVNGVKYATNRTGSATIPSAGFSNTTVGRGGPSGDYFSGQIDDFKIFNYTFNDTLAKTLYNQGAANYGPSTGAP